MREIFSKALGIDNPWLITDVNFDVKAKRLDIKIDFPKVVALTAIPAFIN